MTWFKGQAAEFYDLGIQKLVPRLHVWTMPATMLKNKVMYRHFIHSVAFVNLKCFKAFVSLHAGHTSYYYYNYYYSCKSCLLNFKQSLCWLLTSDSVWRSVVK